MIEFFWETDERKDVDLQLVVPAMEAIIADYQMEVEYINVILMDDEALLGINWQFLEHDYYTDIITFNYAEKGAIEGELYISVDRVAENAEDMGISFDKELFRVVIHGVLHLAGHEDSTDTLRMEMQSLENKYLMLIVSRGT